MFVLIPKNKYSSKESTCSENVMTVVLTGFEVCNTENRMLH